MGPRAIKMSPSPSLLSVWPGHISACLCVTESPAYMFGAAGRTILGACIAATVCAKWLRGW